MQENHGTWATSRVSCSFLTAWEKQNYIKQIWKKRPRQEIKRKRFTGNSNFGLQIWVSLQMPNTKATSQRSNRSNCNFHLFTTFYLMVKNCGFFCYSWNLLRHLVLGNINVTTKTASAKSSLVPDSFKWNEKDINLLIS